MFAVPALTPETMPVVLPTEATDALLLLQVPVCAVEGFVPPVKVILLPTATVDNPDITGSYTVISFFTAQ